MPLTDEQAVERFERFMATQRAARTWEPVTDYSLGARRIIEGKHPELIWEHLIPYDDADVLDYGCGPNGILVRLLLEYRNQHQSHSQVCIVGYDPLVEERIGEPYLVNTFHDSMAGEAKWDLVICREVLEHCPIRQVPRIVRELCHVCAGLIYVTTRFHPSPDHLLDIAESDSLDPTHITLPTKAFLRLLFVLNGYRSRRDLEEKMDWKGLGRCLVMERCQP